MTDELHYVPWKNDPTGDYRDRDRATAERSLEDAAARLKALAFAPQILDKRAYRTAVASYREARARLYAVRATLPPNGLWKDWPDLPVGCPDPDHL